MTIDECVKLLEERGVNDGHLDELVHDAASNMASVVNNCGLAEQVSFLCEEMSPQEVLEAAFGEVGSFDGPSSVCMCSHTGDGPNSEHLTGSTGIADVEEGHGACKISGCDCEKFVWKGFLLDDGASKNALDVEAD